MWFSAVSKKDNAKKTTERKKESKCIWVTLSLVSAHGDAQTLPPRLHRSSRIDALGMMSSE